MKFVGMFLRNYSCPFNVKLVLHGICSVLILGAVRKNPSTARASDANVNTVIRKWLKNAIDRQGGRNSRRQGPQPADN